MLRRITNEMAGRGQHAGSVMASSVRVPQVRDPCAVDQAEAGDAPSRGRNR